MATKRLTILLAIALLIKLTLFVYANSYAPQAKFQVDTQQYLDLGFTLVSQGAFATPAPGGHLVYQYFRTPGYPLFLGILHGILKIPFGGIIIIQILLTIGSAFMVYQTGRKIDERIGPLAFFIILFDPAITIFSLMLLTESLYLFGMSGFLFMFISYLKVRNKRYLCLSALFLTAATFVRPISYFLGIAIAIFILYVSWPSNIKKGLAHGCLFLFIVYGLFFCWQGRNYQRFANFKFSDIQRATTQKEGLYKSYQRNKDPYTQNLPPIPYYLNVTSRSLMSLFTRPASMKYFGSPLLKSLGKLFSYPWILFWISGFLFSLSKIEKSLYYQFLAVIVFYFIMATIGGALWGSGARFRVPMMPPIALMASYGWLKLQNLLEKD